MSYGGGGGGGDEALQKNQSPTLTNMRLAFCTETSAVYKPVSSSEQEQPKEAVSGAAGIVGVGVDVDVADFNINVEPMKRRRGRPRKYLFLDGDLTSPQNQQQSPVVNPTGFQSPPAGFQSPGAASQPAPKKARGRPPGSGGRKNQLNQLGKLFSFQCYMLIIYFIYSL